VAIWCYIRRSNRRDEASEQLDAHRPTRSMLVNKDDDAADAAVASLFAAPVPNARTRSRRSRRRCDINMRARI
jgi:hypothetical protein